MSNRKKYYIENKEKILKYGSQWQKDNPEKVRIYVKKWKKNNPEKVKEQRKRYRKSGRKNELNKLRWKRSQERINNYKLLKGCAICNYNKCVDALEFHHNGDKDFCISGAIGHDISHKRIKEEMDKCIILCSNCHRELHAKLRK